jgi:hypothetical protein
MIDNFEQISGLLKFNSDDDFYHLQIIRRKKENLSLLSSVRLIRSYYIDSIEQLNELRPEIIEICEALNARAYINLNRRSYRRIALESLRKTAEYIANGVSKAAKKAYHSACGYYSKENKRKWIIDIDTHDITIQEEIKQLIPCIIAQIPTKNGIHLIAHPFSQEEFMNTLKQNAIIDERLGKILLDIHKDNPTILYIPFQRINKL